uniref:Uncharacterized protein n=1 Tax=Cacopsylla melanoneura TaxID=428564 RepID=A0A8D9A7I3_9HEMI
MDYLPDKLSSDIPSLKFTPVTDFHKAYDHVQCLNTTINKTLYTMAPVRTVTRLDVAALFVSTVELPLVLVGLAGLDGSTTLGSSNILGRPSPPSPLPEPPSFHSSSPSSSSGGVYSPLSAPPPPILLPAPDPSPSWSWGRR